MPIHDETASTVNLARQIRDGLPNTEFVSLRTATVRLVLDKLIEVGTSRTNVQIDDGARRTVQGMIAPAILEDREGRRGRA